MVQSIVYYGITFWGSTYQSHVIKLKITLHSLIKYNIKYIINIY